MKELEQLLTNAIVLSVLTIISTFYLQRYLRKMTEASDAKKADKQEFNILLLKSSKAQSTFSRELSEALKSGKVNGNIDKAIQVLNQIDEEIEEYLIGKATHE